MVADDPLRTLCLGKLKNIPAQIVCILLVGTQAFLVNHHLVVASVNKQHWLWFVGDAIVVLAFIAGFYLREWRVGTVASKHKEPSGFVKGLPFGSLSWFIYATLLGARIAVIFKTDLQDGGEIGDLKLTICLSAVICVFFTMGHHHNHESLARRAAILSLVKMFTIDLLDTVDILDVLFDTAKDHPTDFPPALEDIVLAVVTLNLMRPIMVLVSLFIDHFGGMKRALKVKVIKTFTELLLLNTPLLIIRVYIAVRYDDTISVFLVKNILGGLYGAIEIYDCCYDIREVNEEEKAEKKVGEINHNAELDSTDIELEGKYKSQISI